MKAIVMLLSLGIAGSGAALITGCDRTLHENEKTTTSNGQRKTQTETVKERPDGSIVKEQTKTRTSDTNPNP